MIIYDPKITGSFQVNGSTVTGIGDVDTISGSVAALNAATSSYALSSSISGSFASLSASLSTRLTDDEGSIDSLNAASSSYLLNTTDTLTGDLTVTGTITAQEFHTEYVSGSIIYTSGSTKFGDSYDDVHEFTGSVNVINSTGGVTGSYTFSGGNFTISGDDADFNLNITSGSSLANLTEFRFQTDGGTMGRLYMHKGNKNMYLGPTYFPTSSLFLQDGTGTVMSITGSSVGIGTSAPETELDILGPTQDQLRLRTAGTEHYRIGRDSSNGLLYFYGSQTGYTGYVFDGVNGERMRINSNGNIGIGTSLPLGKLDIQYDMDVDTGGTTTLSSGITQYGSINFSGAAAQNSGATATTMQGLTWQVNNYGGTNNYGVQAQLVVGNNGSVGTFMGLFTSDNYSNAPVERMRIEADGKVGVGLSSNLSGRLSVKGSGTSNSTNALFVENSAGSYLMAVRDDGETVISGKVGLGTTSPATALHVYNTAPIISMTDSNSVADTGNQFIIRGLGSGGRIQWYDSPSTTMTDIMEFEANGNVGIGTTNAEYKLDVRSSTMAAKFTAGDGGYAAVIFDGDAGNTIGSLTTHNGLVYLGSINSGGTGANGEIRIEPFGGNVMTLDSGGNVGIGNQDPFHKLSVTGTSYFSDQLRVDQPVVSWSDSGTKHYTHLATFSGYGSAASALIINTNIPGHNQSGNANMFTFRIVGYAYGTLGLIDMLVGCYAGENNYYSAYWTGTCQTNWIDNVYVYTNSSGKVAFQIGETTDTLAAEIAITDFVQGFGNVNTSYADSWSCSAVTTLPTQTQKTTLSYKRIIPDVYEDVTFHNSVGVGTTAPAEKLHIESGIRVNNYVSADSNFISYNQRAYYTDNWRKTSSGRARQFQMGEDNGGTLEYRISNVAGGSAGDAISWTSLIKVLDSGGITFNGDTAAANALDDYEEGTWTPTYPSYTTGAPSSSGGTYTKIGKRVIAQFKISGFSASTGNHYIIITGLPYVQYIASHDENGYCNVYPNGNRTMGIIINNSSGNTTQWYAGFNVTSTISSGGALRGTIIYTTT